MSLDSTWTFSNIHPSVLQNKVECPPHMWSEKQRNLLGTCYDLFCREPSAQTCGPTWSPVEGRKLWNNNHGIILEEWDKPCLECHVACFICSFHHNNKLKPLLSKVSFTHLIKWRVFINNMNDIKRPDKEDATFFCGVWWYFQVLHFLEYFSFLTDPPP